MINKADKNQQKYGIILRRKKTLQDSPNSSSKRTIKYRKLKSNVANQTCSKKKQKTIARTRISRLHSAIHKKIIKKKKTDPLACNCNLNLHARFNGNGSYLFHHFS
jgi:hypothetical protein